MNDFFRIKCLIMGRWTTLESFSSGQRAIEVARMNYSDYKEEVRVYGPSGAVLWSSKKTRS